VKKFHSARRIAATAQSVPVLPEGIQVKPVQSAQQYFKGQNRLRRYLAAQCSNQVIFGGGSVFQTASDIRDKIIMMRLAGRNGHRAVGVGLGPFKDSVAEQACAEAIKHMDFIGVRDAASFDIARSLVSDAPVVKTFDLAPLIFDAFEFEKPIKRKKNNKKSIGLALCPFESIYGGADDAERLRIQKIFTALSQLDPAEISELVFIDFNGHPYFGDTKVHREIAALLKGKFATRCVSYSPDLRNSLNEIAQLDTILAMRLHAAVFSYLVETPTIVMSYHAKCAGWAHDIGLPAVQVLNSNSFASDELLTLLTQGLNQELGKPGLAPESARQQALLNWQRGSRK
jgi:polysaccharide pyruvyl transferase WcaK-like protein